MKIRFIISFFCFALLLNGCSNGIVGGSFQENMEKLDKVYGYCDNPQRNIQKRSQEYKICKDKEAAAGADGLADGDFKLPFADGIFQNQKTKIEYVNSVNQYLWNGAIDVLSAYPLKNVDSSGGYIETEWITESKDLRNQRCLVKVQITSLELVSNGLKTTILCQNKENEDWINSDESYDAEEKQIILAILASSREYYNQDQALK